MEAEITHVSHILCNQKINRQFTYWQKVNNKSKQRKKSILVYNGKEVLETNLSFVVRPCLKAKMFIPGLDKLAI